MLGKGTNNSIIIIKSNEIRYSVFGFGFKVSGSGIKTVITIPNSR